MKVTRQKLQSIKATQCACEELICRVNDDGTLFASHMAFDVEDRSGKVVGRMALRMGMYLPLKWFQFTPAPSSADEGAKP